MARQVNDHDSAAPAVLFAPRSKSPCRAQVEHTLPAGHAKRRIARAASTDRVRRINRDEEVVARREASNLLAMRLEVLERSALISLTDWH